MTEPLITPAEWHAAGGPAPKTQANWRTQGRGPKYIKVGNLIRLRAADIAEWVEARRVQSTSELTAA